MRLGGLEVQAAGISLVEHVGAVLEGIEGMPESLRIGAPRVLPLPKGEPGGRVVGRGKEIEGVFRLVRVKHSLSDWWADMGALLGLAKWLNERTQIRTDLNVEGGAVQLTDAPLLKSPLLWMTGHDPSFIQVPGSSRCGRWARMAAGNASGPLRQRAPPTRSRESPTLSR